MKTKFKIAVLAMIGLNINLRAQDQTINGDLTVKGASSSQGASHTYSTETGKTNFRLTTNMLDADNAFIYNYNSQAKTFHNLNIGGAHSASNGLQILGNGNIGMGSANPFTNLHIHSNNVDTRIALTNNHSGKNVSDGFVLINESDSEVHFLNRENAALKFSTYGAERMRIAANGNIGIGTNNPQNWFGGKLLQVSDTRPILSLKSSGNLGTIQFTNNNIASNHYGEFHLNHSYLAANPNKSKLEFWSYPGNNVLTLLADGNIGIGKTSPSSPLDIKSSKNRTLSLDFTGAQPGWGYTWQSFKTNSTEQWRIIGREDINSSLSFWNSSDKDILTLSQNGNVGIGNKTPKSKLDVRGLERNQFRIYREGFDDKYLSVWHGTAGAVIEPIKTDNSTSLLYLGGYDNPTDVLIASRHTGNVGIGIVTPDAKLSVTSKENLISRFQNLEINDNIKGVRVNSKNSHNQLKYLDIAIDAKNEKAGLGLGTSSGNLPIGKADLSLAQLVIDRNYGGSVGIGTTDTKGFKLGVKGKIAAEEVKVATYTNWPDYVFENNYDLPTLNEVENHIQKNGHLKDIPSAEEVSQEGFFLGSMDAKLLQKIEELTLYTIAQEKQLKVQEEKIKTLENQTKEIEKLKALVNKLLKK
ncbi:hypothetical protein [Tenacibaculum xiamenense]|uniref:hypothetical protein n=1 Tax=Tenacibaculum xiamenense TaxID=1261553 RepID=UPI003895D7A8